MPTSELTQHDPSTNVLIRHHDSTMDTSNAIVLDSLPYIETNIHPDYEAYAMSLIEEEMQNFPIRSDVLDHLPNPLLHEIPLFGTQIHGQKRLVQAEYRALLDRGGNPRVHAIDYWKNYEGTDPSHTSADNQEEQYEIWQYAIRQAKITLEYQRNRLMNLELQSEFESSLWRHYNATLELHHLEPMSRAVEYQQNLVDRINATRKEIQETQAAPKLMGMENRYNELVNTNQRLAYAVATLQQEVDNLRKELGEEELPDHGDNSSSGDFAFKGEDDDYYD